MVYSVLVFLREYIKSNYAVIIHEIEHHHEGRDQEQVEEFLETFNQASVQQKGQLLQQLKKNTAKAELTKEERKMLTKNLSSGFSENAPALVKIAAAWLITVPASASHGRNDFFSPYAE